MSLSLENSFIDTESRPMIGPGMADALDEKYESENPDLENGKPQNGLTAVEVENLTRKHKHALDRRNKANALGGSLINSSLFVSNVTQLKSQLDLRNERDNVAVLTLLIISIILQIIVGIVTIIEIAGLRWVGASHTSEDKAKRSRGHFFTIFTMILAFLISIVNYFIAAFIE